MASNNGSPTYVKRRLIMVHLGPRAVLCVRLPGDPLETMDPNVWVPYSLVKNPGVFRLDQVTEIVEFEVEEWWAKITNVKA